MAAVLSQQGKPQEAMALYEQSLRTKQELGDLREVAVTQANFSQLLLQQGEQQRALQMAWQAYTDLHEHGYTYDAQIMQQLLITLKGQVLGPEPFDALWAQLFQGPQPNWLTNVEASSNGAEQQGIAPAQLEVIVANTVTVMTEMLEKQEEWHEAMEAAFHHAQQVERVQDAEFFAALLDVLDGQTPSLPEGHPYRAGLKQIQEGIAAGESRGGRASFVVAEEVMQVVLDFVNAEDWEATRQMLEAQQELLFQPEVELLFEQNITQAQADGEERVVRLLELHLTLLRACKASSIEEAFARLAADQEGEDEEADDVLPFDPQLISRTIAALLDGPQQKMEHMQYLTAMVNEKTDEDLKTLINTIQLAMFSNDLSQLGRDLKGVYKQAWETIAASIEVGDVDPRIFATIATSTLAVLGPAANRRGEWRGNLADVRNQATARGDRNMAALLDAVIGLMDAGGDPAGLGEGLKGIYARTWQAIVEGLPE